MNESCFRFGVSALPKEELVGRKVVEIGSYDHNGTLRKHFESLGPASYLGIDIIEGPGVDAICGIDDLTKTYGENSFDVVISTEVLEHVMNWQSAISNLKRIVRPGGLLVLTTRSFGFPYHAYPHDFWRYEVSDMREIFSDFEMLMLEGDVLEPGVFLKARKPAVFSERDVSNVRLYSMLTRRRQRKVGRLERWYFDSREYLRKRLAPIIPAAARGVLKKAFPRP